MRRIPPLAFGAATAAAQREANRAYREATAAAQKEANRAAREAQRTAREAERQRTADARAHDRMVRTGISTAGRVFTSRTSQAIVRGVLGTLLGGKR